MSTDQDSMEKVVCLRIRNLRANELTFYLEPWGELYTLAPTSVFDVIAKGPAVGFLELECGDGEIILYGWTGSVVSVFQDGIELGGGSERIVAPPLPDNQK